MNYMEAIALLSVKSWIEIGKKLPFRIFA